MVDSLRQILLGLFAKLKVLDSDLTHKLEILFELTTRRHMVVVEFHAGDMRIGSRTDPERGHATSVDIQGAVGKEIEKETIVRFLGVRDVLGEIVLVANTIGSRRVVDRKRGMGILAVQTLLIPINPIEGFESSILSESIIMAYIVFQLKRPS